VTGSLTAGTDNTQPSWLLVAVVPETVIQSNPGMFDTLPDSTSYAYDVRAYNVSTSARAQVTFAYPTGGGPPTLTWFDPALGANVPVLGSSLQVGSLVFDSSAHTVRIIFDQSSFPSLQDTNGTLFTLTVPLPATPVPAATLSPANSPATALNSFQFPPFFLSVAGQLVVLSIHEGSGSLHLLNESRGQVGSQVLPLSILFSPPSPSGGSGGSPSPGGNAPSASPHALGSIRPKSLQQIDNESTPTGRRAESDQAAASTSDDEAEVAEQNRLFAALGVSDLYPEKLLFGTLISDSPEEDSSSFALLEEPEESDTFGETVAWFVLATVASEAVIIQGIRTSS
jgi:hypothetical protein